MNIKNNLKFGLILLISSNKYNKKIIKEKKKKIKEFLLSNPISIK